ncbi:Nucleotide-binding, alpha-beta plait [Cordyceps fumosorosea ARSEF 2679]|uniref:Nucleotide-binding, alpha-beta plait n=1 Tax=Cordyceps fumosorosea (strain ARSEF 2679) TaxID=1081104 RepID=A0A168EJE4_CORFA|nr:Nucleotide-binding, alpha-beta plait [Cordyceps fumosorosea ARSEF 2679]OAA73883.1 Nucleotide-binding, alpha-beta plait [Cordyceps fumosorosea ARSEF 2679]
MAPELRKRKQAPEPAKPAPKVEKPAPKVEKPAGKGKRKAAEQASPASAKKSKPAKEAPAPKPAPKKTTKAKEETPKTNGKKKPAAPVEEPAEEPADGEEEDEEENNDALVLATELDSGDDEADGVTLFEEGQDVGTIPSVSKAVREGVTSEAASGERGVVYVGRIPHGFYEHEMRQYFSQFGPISRLRLSRNKKTGASKHFAFVEFTERSTAEVVAKTMDNYLLFGHILKCQVVPPARVHEALFKGANRRFKKVPWTSMAGRKLEKPRSESAWGLKVERETKKRADKAAKLKALGYEFEGPEIKAVPAPGAPAAEENAATENGDAVETKEAIEAAPVEEPKVEELKVEEPKAKPTKATKAKGGKAKKAKA